MVDCSRRGAGAGAIAWIAALALFGCSHEIDTTRVDSERGTLGEEIYEVVCQRIASEENPTDVSGRESRALCAGEAGPEAATTPRLRALAENRERLVPALDRVMPAELEDDVGDFMIQLLPFYEPPEDRLPRQTRATADVIERLMNDEEALAALERLSTRDGYRPLRLSLGVARPVLAYPEFDDFATRALDTIDEGGAAGEEWDAMLRALALEMATAEPDAPDGGETTLRIARDLLYTEDRDFAVGPPLWLTQRDDRGIVMVATSTGGVPEPFVDVDGDGLADVDALGRFVDGSGGLLMAPSPFRTAGELGIARDPSGRALRTDGSHYYAYLNANQTMLAGVTREATHWFDPGAPVLMDMAYGVPALLGPRVPLSEGYGAATLAYDGPDTREGALFDLLHATGAILPRDTTDDVLALTDILVNEHESELTALIQTGLTTDRLADGRDAALRQPNNLWDDLIQVAVWIAQEPGLLEAVLRSFADPRSRYLGRIYEEMMVHRDLVGLDATASTGPYEDVIFDDDVERGTPDVEGNLSIFTRSLSVIHDLNGVKMCNKEGATLSLYGITLPGSYGECDLLEVNNVAEMYALAIIERAELVLKPALLNFLLRIGGLFGLTADRILEQESGIEGLTTHPTPEALNRLVFAPRNDFLQALIDPPVSRDGVPVEERHPGTVFAWERKYSFGGTDPVSFYDAMSPLLEAFDDYDRRTVGPGIAPDSDPEKPRFLFAELITALHLHWSSAESDHTQSADPSAPFYAYQDDGVSYEENVADAFGRQGKLLERLHEISVVLEATEVRPGVDGIDVLARAAEEMVNPELNPGLTTRDGAARLPVNDGSRDVEVTPLYLFLHALANMDDAFAAEPERHEPWLRARGALVDQLLQVSCGGGCEMQNRRTLALLRVLVPFMRERIAAHREAGDLDEWARTMDERAADSMSSPMGAALVYFLDAIQADPEARDALASLVGYLVDEASDNDAFAATLLAVADMLQVLEDDLNLVPLLRALSPMLAPGARETVASGGELVLDGSATDETMNLLREINAVDDRRTLKAMMANMVSLEPGEEETPLEVVIDVIAEVNRADAGAGTRMTSEDYRETFSRAHDFLTNESRGIERLYDVIQQRELE